MAEFFDARETRAADAREADLAARLPALIAAALRAPAWQRQLGAVDPRTITSRAALARLPLLRKGDLIGMQKAAPPLAEFAPSLAPFGRLFSSPGPIYEPEGLHDDAWRAGRAFFAAGVRRGDRVLNTLSYHLTPGGFICDSGARAVGALVIPAGPGNTTQQLDVIEHLKPDVYAGTPDFLKILLDAATAAARDATSIRKALVSGAAFPPSLQAEIKRRGIDAYQMYATADLGCVAYESPAREGLIVAEDVLLEIVRPGTGDPVAEGEVGEVVVTSFDHDHPWIRLALGDLSAAMPGVSSCGRTNMRIRGWMGRADQTTKVKGMFVRPEQIAQTARHHQGIGRMRLVVARAAETDTMTLKAECAAPSEALRAALGDTLRSITKLGGSVELVAPGSLPNDGKVIEDARPPV